jgi:hypothetical protein
MARHIYKKGAQPALMSALQQLFVAEMLRPSSSVWLISPWISDLEVIDNSTYGFQHLAPEWPLGGVRLSTVLAALLERQVAVQVVTRPMPPAYRRQDAHNATQRFVQELKRQAPEGAQLLVIRDKYDAREHSKGILTERVMMHGSMNLTYSGVRINGEHVRLTRDSDEISEAYLACIDRWGMPKE